MKEKDKSKKPTKKKASARPRKPTVPKLLLRVQDVILVGQASTELPTHIARHFAKCLLSYMLDGLSHSENGGQPPPAIQFGESTKLDEIEKIIVGWPAYTLMVAAINGATTFYGNHIEQVLMETQAVVSDEANLPPPELTDKVKLIERVLVQALHHLEQGTHENWVMSVLTKPA